MQRVNALSFDVEDYFQVQALADAYPRDSWDCQESRVVRNTNTLLAVMPVLRRKPAANGPMIEPTRPIAVERVEWFASCHDLCRAMMRLRELEQRPGLAPVGEILRANPGLPYDKSVWKSVGFKGGSEPGVMNLTFLLERHDGRWFALSAGWCSQTETLEESRLAELARKGMEMLAAHE